MTLRDALAAALDDAARAWLRSFGPNEPFDWQALAGAATADPAFRAALTEAVAEGYIWCHEVDHYEPMTWATNDSPNETAGFIVAHMLGESLP